MSLKDFFDSERKRVFEPGPFFTSRVMARLNGGHRMEGALWEMIPTSVRPVLILALVLILGFMAGELFMPRVPNSGMVEASLESEQVPGEGILYGEDEEVPNGPELLEQLIVLEDGQ
jgi:hypothetical protein